MPNEKLLFASENLSFQAAILFIKLFTILSSCKVFRLSFHFNMPVRSTLLISFVFLVSTVLISNNL